MTDANIDSIVVQSDDGSTFLQTSPEYAMKRLLAAGYPDIYQVCKVFRDGESGRYHQTEFTMVEWYRHACSLEQMMQETVAFAAHLLHDRAPKSEATYTTYRDAFAQALGIDPLTDGIDTLQEAAGTDARLRESLGDDRDAWLDLLMSTKVATRFEREGLTVVYHYPAAQAALAKLDAQDPAVAERFELFLGDVELANGFVELTDATEQLARFEADRTKRRADGKTVPEIDPWLIAALQSGLPDCAGVALGLDRLLMRYAGASALKDVMTFTLDDER